MAKSFVKGAIILTICGLVGKVIGAFYRIPFAMIVGAEGVGLYQLVYPLFTLMITLSTSGLPSSISKILSEQWANGEYSLARKSYKLAFLLIISLSAFCTLIILTCCYPIAKLQGNTNAFGCYLAISPAVFFVGIISGIRGYFQAKENMVPTAVSGLIEQITKVIFGLTIAYFLRCYGIVWSTIGALVGVTISEIFASIYLVISYVRSQKKFVPVILSTVPISQTNKQILKRILGISVPIAIGGIIMPMSLLIDSGLIVKMLSSTMSVSSATTLYGLQSGVVGSLSNLPVVASVGVATAILPKISREKALNNTENVKIAVKSAFLFVLLVCLPCAICLYIFSEQIVLVLYSKTFTGQQIDICIKLLKLSSINVVTLSLAQVTAGMLQGLGKVKVPVISLAVGSVVKVISLIILVKLPTIGILGAEISDAICYAFAAVINILVLHKFVAFNSVFDSLKAIVLAVFIGASAYALNLLFVPKVSSIFSLLLAGGITAIVYISALATILYYKQKHLKHQFDYNRKASTLKAK